MTVLLATIIKVSLVTAAGLTATALLRRRSAAVRHWVLAATVFCALATPFLERTLPAWRVPVATRKATATTGSTVVTITVTPGEFLPLAPGGQTPQPSAESAGFGVLPIAWLVGTVVSLGILLVGLVRLAWLASRARAITDGPWASVASAVAREYGVRRPVRVLQSDHAALLVTWGLTAPKVLISSSALAWSDEQIRIVLRHELAHISRGDWIAQLAGEVLRAAYWFNPLLWFACTRLRVESELACDDEVLARGVSAGDYAAHLLEVARTLRRAPRLPAPAMARPSRLERRFDAMLNNGVTRTPATRAFRVWTAAAFFGATCLVSAAGQSGRSTLSGSVIDPTGAPVPGVAVSLWNTAAQAKFEVKTDNSGRYEFVPLPAGEYVLRAEVMGFKKAEDTVRLDGKATRHDLTLALGSLTESITIVGEPGGVVGGVPRGVAGGIPGGVRGGVATSVDVDGARRRFEREMDACQASTTGGRIRPPKKIKDVRPVYPENLMPAGVAGTVILTATIGADGTVGNIEVLRSVHPEIDASAIEAVRQWQFDGTLLNCKPTEVSMTVSLNFSTK
jgi:TonB family protein